MDTLLQVWSTPVHLEMVISQFFSLVLHLVGFEPFCFVFFYTFQHCEKETKGMLGYQLVLQDSDIVWHMHMCCTSEPVNSILLKILDGYDSAGWTLIQTQTTRAYSTALCLRSQSFFG